MAFTLPQDPDADGHFKVKLAFPCDQPPIKKNQTCTIFITHTFNTLYLKLCMHSILQIQEVAREDHRHCQPEGGRTAADPKLCKQLILRPLNLVFNLV